MKPETVKRIRHLHGLTQQEVANMLGVSRSTIHLIETNRMTMSERLRRKFCEVFKVDDEMIRFIERF